MIALMGDIGVESQPGPVTHRPAGSSAGTSSGAVFNFTQADWQVGDYLFVAVDGEPNTPTITGGAGGWTLDTVTDAAGFKFHVLRKQLVLADLTTLTVNVTNGGTSIGYRSYRGVMTVAYLQAVATAASAPSLTFSTITPDFLSSMLLANLKQAGGVTWAYPSGWGNAGASGAGVFVESDTIAYPSPGAPTFTVTSTPAASGQIGQLYELVGYPL